MNTRTKSLIAATAVLIVAFSLMASVVFAANAEQNNSAKPQTDLKAVLAAQQLMKQRPLLAKKFFDNAMKETIIGAVTAKSGNILVVSAAGGQRFNIVLPNRWETSGTVIPLSQVFEKYLAIGNGVTLKTLKSAVTNTNGVSVTFIYCYEIMDTTSNVKFTSVTPYNIN